MRETVRTQLADRYEDIRVVRQLHDVPPHEVYELQLDGIRAVYKGDTGPTGSAGIEGPVMAWLGERTTIPVPEVLHYDGDYHVTAYEPAAPSPDDDPGVDQQWARAAGRGLARLHDETVDAVDGYGPLEPAPAVLSTARHENWHGGALEYLRRRKPVLERFGHADIAEEVLRALKARPELTAGAGPAVCCHGWATPEHVTTADGEVTCFVDFEHAIGAPAEFDYWRTVVPAFGLDSTPEARAFRDGYEEVRELPPRLEERQSLYSLLNGIYFFESLYVQDQHGPEETGRKARNLREGIKEVLADLE